jgi:hypothetical protein
MIISAATPSLCIASILTDVGHQRTGRRISDYLHRKETQGLSTKDPPNIAKGVVLQIVVTATAEVHTQRNPCTACTMVVTPTTTPKIAPFSLKPSRKWSNNPLNLRNNHYLEK